MNVIGGRLALALVLLIGSVSVLGAERTNEIYITVPPKPVYQDFGKFTQAEVANASTNIECRAAELDIEGHWGANMAGFQLSLRLAQTNYASGERIPCTVLLRNTSQQVLIYDFDNWGARWCFGTDFVVERGGKRLPPGTATSTNFVQKLSFIRQSSWGHLRLAPGTQCKFTCNLGDQFDCSGPGRYRVKAIRSFPKPDGSDALLYVSSAFAEFEVTTEQSHQGPHGAAPKPGKQ